MQFRWHAGSAPPAKASVRVFKEYKSHGYKDNGDEILLRRCSIACCYGFDVRLPHRRTAIAADGDLKINGASMYQNQIVPMDIDTLRTLQGHGVSAVEATETFISPTKTPASRRRRPSARERS